jgi:hypothetical protein
VPKKTESTEPSDKKVLVKFYLPPMEHRLLRAVVAIGDTTIEGFCRELVLEKVRTLTSQMTFPKEMGERSRRN